MANSPKAQEGDINPEAFRRRFRGKEYHQGVRPRALAQELKDACRRWLQPDRCSKEDLIDQMVMEQFLHVISSRGRMWVMRHRPASLDEAVQRLEDFLAAETPGGVTGSSPAKASVTNPRNSAGTGGLMHSGTPSQRRSRPHARQPVGPSGTLDKPRLKGDGWGAGPQEYTPRI
uniref:SCAN box domain-containing protein n=1 Tax=Pelusios castaneus TaxID=367368 RepID=A0A8C8SC80_9SAUR